MRRGTGRGGRRAPAVDAVLTEVRALPVLVVAGLAVAALWRLLAPGAARGGNPVEAAAAVDGTLVLLSIPAGVVTAAFVLMRPGSRPALRAAVVLVGAVLAGGVSWLVGDLLGSPPLRARGAAMVWPIITAAGMFVGSFVPALSRRLDPPQPAPLTDRDAPVGL